MLPTAADNEGNDLEEINLSIDGPSSANASRSRSSFSFISNPLHTFMGQYVKLPFKDQSNGKASATSPASPRTSFSKGFFSSTRWLRRKIQGFSLRKPFTCGVCFTFYLCVVPLLITIAVLSGRHGPFNAYLQWTVRNGFEGFAVTSQNGVVATDNPICSIIARDILRQGKDH